MNIEDLNISVLNVIDSQVCSAVFYCVLRTNDGLALKQFNMDKLTQEQLGAEFIKSIRNQISRENVTLSELSNADDRANAVYHYDLDVFPPQLGALEMLLATEIEDQFDFSKDSLRDLEAILVLIGNQDNQLVIYKHHYSVTLLQKQSGFSLIRSPKSNRFERLDDDVLKINSKFEFLMIDGQCYVFDLITLERFYGFQEAIKNLAIQGIEHVTASNLIVDVTVLSARLSDLTFCRKLARLNTNSPVLGIVPNHAVIDFVSNHPKLAGKFSLSEDGKKFSIKTKISQNLFLKLLNDDYLKSLLTQIDYESLAKDSMTDEVQAA